MEYSFGAILTIGPADIQYLGGCMIKAQVVYVPYLRCNLTLVCGNFPVHISFRYQRRVNRAKNLPGTERNGDRKDRNSV